MRQEQTEEAGSGWVPQEDLWGDRTLLPLGDGGGPGSAFPAERAQCRRPELAEQVCSRHRTKEQLRHGEQEAKK